MTTAAIAIEEPTAARRWWAFAAVAVGLVFLARCAAAYFHPILWGDDWNLFVRFVHTPGAGAILQHYAGYVSVVPSAFGWVAAQFPSGARPFVLAWASLGIGVVALTWFCSPRFAHLVADVRHRALCCLLLALAPASNHPLLAAMMFASWHLLFVACLATVAKAPTTARQSVLRSIAVGLCIVSHPISFVLFPFFGWRAWQATTRHARWHFGALATLAGLYFLSGVNSSGEARIGDLGDTAFAALEFLTHRVVGDSILPASVRAEVPVTLPGFVLFALPIAATLGLALRRSQRGGPVPHAVCSLLLITCGLIVAITLGRFDENGKLLYSPRYTYVPTLCWYLAALIALCTAVRVAAPQLRTATLAVLTLQAASLNLERDFLYRTSPSDGDRVVAFAREIGPWLATDEPPSMKSLPLPGRRLNIERPRRP